MSFSKPHSALQGLPAFCTGRCAHTNPDTPTVTPSYAADVATRMAALRSLTVRGTLLSRPPQGHLGQVERGGARLGRT